MTLQKFLGQTIERTIATFDFFDLGTGKGIAVLNGGDGEGPIYSLGKREFYGHDGSTRGLDTALDIDFDVKFLRPLIIEGSTIVNVTAILRRVSGGSSARTSTITITLRHFDGSTETDLASDSHVLSGTLNDGESVIKLIAFDMDIARRHFAIGEILRLTIAASDPGTTTDITIFHDPKNRAFTVGNATTVSSKCELYIPIVTFI